MIRPDEIRNYFPVHLRDNAVFSKYILKEYLLLLILDFISTSPYIRKITFIGGTSIRLIKGIDRFSEDLDFDCKAFSREEFIDLTDGILKYLRNNGIPAEPKDSENPKLKAFRRNIYFPGLLVDLGLTGHRDERFLIKVETQDRLIQYKSETIHIKGCGFFFPMSVPPAPVLCAMKVSAMLDRQKGRDFYDTMFLLSQTMPDFDFLSQKMGISNLTALKEAAETVIMKVDLKSKMRDFEHLLFNKKNATRILRAAEFFRSL